MILQTRRKSDFFGWFSCMPQRSLGVLWVESSCVCDLRQHEQETSVTLVQWKIFHHLLGARHARTRPSCPADCLWDVPSRYRRMSGGRLKGRPVLVGVTPCLALVIDRILLQCSRHAAGCLHVAFRTASRASMSSALDLWADSRNSRPLGRHEPLHFRANVVSRMVRPSFTLCTFAFANWRAHMSEVNPRLVVAGLVF